MDLKTAAENDFEHCERDELVVFCDVLGVEYLPQNNAKALRKKLLEQLGRYTELLAGGTGDDKSAPAFEGEDLDVDELTSLNLKAQGKWQGRRRRIVLHRAADHVSTFPQFFAWADLHCYIPFGEECAIPFPIWNILDETTRGQRLIRKRRVDEDGRIYYEEVWVNSQRFMFSDLGDDPETAHLPRDMHEQFRWMHHKTDSYDGYSLQQFKDMCRMLKVPLTQDNVRTYKMADYKRRICSTIGLGAGLAHPLARTPKKKKEAA